MVNALADVPEAERPHFVNLALGQNDILELIANGSPLGETLASLLRFLEREVPEMLCSVLLLDRDGVHLRYGAAPSLPAAYSKAIDGASIGPRAGSCGTAAYFARQVVVVDTEIDPLWSDYRELARQYGLRACWSTPIVAADGTVLGTFAMYFREPRSPTRIHERLIAIATHIAAIAIGKDLRETAVREAQLRIEHLAYHEPVTELPNRTAMQRDLLQATEKADAENGELSLLLVNLNYFRDINDSLGHQNGDRLLRRVAERLREAAGRHGHVASLGGDEFAVLLPRSEQDDGLATVQDSLHRPFELVGIPIKLEATAGIAVYPRDGATPQLLWQHADIALRTAKEIHAPHLYYHARIDHCDSNRLALVSELERALTGNQLVLHYQPKIDLRSGRTMGLEALVRWVHPAHGLIAPDAFMPLAERTALINPLTELLLAAAIRDTQSLAQQGLPLEIAVNLSAKSLYDPEFCKGLLALVHAAGFPVSQLTFEITETAIVSDPSRAQAGLAELREAGIHLAMDDFGVGQSSLTYLKDLPITKMKIDKSFVMEFHEPRNAAIVRSAIDMARNLGLNVTAEGVEHEATCDALRAMGCDVGQGYFFSRPLAIDALTGWLRETRWRSAN